MLSVSHCIVSLYISSLMTVAKCTPVYIEALTEWLYWRYSYLWSQLFDNQCSSS